MVTHHCARSAKGAGADAHHQCDDDGSHRWPRRVRRSLPRTDRAAKPSARRADADGRRGVVSLSQHGAEGSRPCAGAAVARHLTVQVCPEGARAGGACIDARLRRPAGRRVESSRRARPSARGCVWHRQQRETPGGRPYSASALFSATGLAADVAVNAPAAGVCSFRAYLNRKISSYGRGLRCAGMGGGAVRDAARMAVIGESSRPVDRLGRGNWIRR